MKPFRQLRCIAACARPSSVIAGPIPAHSRRCAPHQRSTANHAFQHHAEAISVLRTNVDTSSHDYKENVQAFEDVMGKMESLHSKIELGGPSKARDKHIARGKMLPRE